MTKQLSSWTDQYITILLAVCGFLAVCFTGVVAYHYKELAGEVKKVPVLEQRLNTIEKDRGAFETSLREFQTTTARQTISQAVFEERLGVVAKRLEAIETSMQQLLQHQNRHGRLSQETP